MVLDYGEKLTPADIEWWMAERGIVETELEENPSNSRKPANSLKVSGAGRFSALDDDDDD